MNHSTSRLPRFSRLLSVPGLVALGLGLGLVLYPAPSKKVSGAGENATPPPDFKSTTACFGHVDLENGVSALSPAQPGRVSDVLIHENDQVKEGAPLVRLESNLHRLKAEEAEAALEAARRTLTQAQTLEKELEFKVLQQEGAVTAAREKLAGAEFLRDHKQDLVDNKFAKRKELDISQAQVRELRAMVKVEQEKLAEIRLHHQSFREDAIAKAQAEVAIVKSRLDQARELLDQCTIKAPKGGTILRILTSQGEMVGSPPRPAALHFWPSSEPLVVRVEVDQEFGSVKEGQAALVEDYFDPAGFKGVGKVKRCSHWYTQRRTILDDPLLFKDVRTLECIISDVKSAAKDDDQKSFRIGQRMRVRIQKP